MSTVQPGGSSTPTIDQSEDARQGKSAGNGSSAFGMLSEDELAQFQDGLTQEEVDRRRARGESNEVDDSTSRPVSAILRSNLFTIFNGILFVCVAAVLALGDWRDAVFGFVLVFNLAIGVFSELRSKKALDSLAVLQAPTSEALRDGTWVEVDNAHLVTHDVIRLKLGDQIPADGQALEVKGLEIDESALTGESRSVRKNRADAMMSGTAVVAGTGKMLVEVIGADAWAQKITAEARKFSKVHSEIQDSINRILKWITIVLPWIIALLLWSQMRAGDNSWRTAIIFTVAGVVGMIPQGLVLLTSMNFGLAAAILARRGVLIQELPAVEVLARVDVLCLDKTGTLTTGDIRGREIIPNPGRSAQTLTLPEGNCSFDAASRAILAAMVADEANATAVAVAQLVPDRALPFTDSAHLTPFSSVRKWSALEFTDGAKAEGGADSGDASVADAQPLPKTWVMGAPEILLANAAGDTAWAKDAVAQAGDAGRRSVCLSFSMEALVEDVLPQDLTPALVAILEEDVRPDAKETLDYFRQQGVTIKVISGDAPKTVTSIASDLGLQHEGGSDLVALDARTLSEVGTPEFEAAALETDVFGRVTPEQKRGLVHALQHAGHTVAMTGDGVNDALALKDADLGIAMGNAAPATKAVSRLVLVNGKFSDLPGVVAEGRRIIANMERVSALFLSKTTYAMLLAVVVAIFGWSYPFLPRQLTYIGTFTIGTPAFFLALGPNGRRYRPGFLKRTLLVAVPTGAILAVAALTSYVILGQGSELGQTAATISLMIGAMALLVILARPWNWRRITLVVLMISGAIVGMLVPVVRDFFALAPPTGHGWRTILLAGGVAGILIVSSYLITSRWRDTEK